MNWERAIPGHFYAVGVGPGAPDLLTMRAAKLIETADVIVAPRSRRAEESLALQAVKHLVVRQEIVDHVYAMQRDVDETMRLWRQIADLVVERCNAGRSVVQITIGDPLIYSTSCYLLDLLQERMSAESMHVVPGISAFQSVASRFHEAICIQEDRVMIMPATHLDRVAQALDRCETLILYKAGKNVRQLADLLESKGLLDQARLVCYAEQGGKEFVSTNILQAADGRHGYMATVIVHIGRQGWHGKDLSGVRNVF